MLLNASEYRDEAIDRAKWEAYKRNLDKKLAQPGPELQQVLTEHSASVEEKRRKAEATQSYQEMRSNIRTRVGSLWIGIVCGFGAVMCLAGSYSSFQKQDPKWSDILFALLMFAFCSVVSVLMFRNVIKGERLD